MDFLFSEVSLTSLIPSLDRRGNGIQDDGEVKRSWVVPTISLLKLKFASLSLLETFDVIEAQWILSGESSALEKRKDVHQIGFLRECFDIFK
jgi:hypothetical protein